MNNVILIGRLTKDPESRMIPNTEKTVTSFTIAIDRPFAKEKTADFFKIITFGKTAENCSRFLTKGQLVGVSGRLQNSRWETESGEKRTSTEIVADRVEFLESKKDKDDLPEGMRYQALEDDDEIPF